MIVYRIDVLQALKEKDFSSYRLRRDKIIGQREIQALRKGRLVSWAVLDKICELLNKQPGDIIKYIPDSNEMGEQPVSSPVVSGS